jgi:beta-N-acetylhexosaminidase
VAYAREFLKGLRSAGVLGSAKHFPGLGEANLDTHHELPNVDKSWTRLWEEDIYPYRAMKRELPMVLIGHASYPRVTPAGMPASLSRKWITEVLQKKIGYRGLIVSDDLEMGGVLKAAPIEQAAVQHIRAGGDLCLVCHIEEYVTRSFEALVHEAEKDRKFARRVEESVERVLAFKRKSAEINKNRLPLTVAKIQKLVGRSRFEARLPKDATSSFRISHDRCRSDERHLGRRNQCCAGSDFIVVSENARSETQTCRPRRISLSA